MSAGIRAPGEYTVLRIPAILVLGMTLDSPTLKYGWVADKNPRASRAHSAIFFRRSILTFQSRIIGEVASITSYNAAATSPYHISHKYSINVME